MYVLGTRNFGPSTLFCLPTHPGRMYQKSPAARTDWSSPELRAGEAHRPDRTAYVQGLSADFQHFRRGVVLQPCSEDTLLFLLFWLIGCTSLSKCTEQLLFRDVSTVREPWDHSSPPETAIDTTQSLQQILVPSDS